VFNRWINDATSFYLSDINTFGIPSFYFLLICYFFDYFTFYNVLKGNFPYNFFGTAKGLKVCGALSTFLY
jgi:hypothetical protein